ncbi:NADH-quinone oxidoreductase subunit J family protein [Taibaiella chishuiensis]|uniref:NADH-quinone oxidoreductase subunit J n=1 Tax=Taibaiella chishuiensis TaxID=1434707 RepID=A0A2P8D9X6_9BACT|nr:NADH-quinone oxidoreductase subunit J [Taibaiella chishuiensis]PSK94019.1 NADH dehydrogenase subunit J [Taibaiella chishuiensis]
MHLHEILFWFLSFMAIVCALGVILSRNPVKSVLFLIATFFSISGHYVLMNAQFLAVVNIIVYAGAIMVLFLFVIMLMNLNADAEPQKSRLVQMAAVLSGGALFLVIIAALRTVDLNNKAMITSEGDLGLIHNLGMVLFKEYVLPFELSSVLFLAAMVGAMVIGKKEEVIQNP